MKDAGGHVPKAESVARSPGDPLGRVAKEVLPKVVHSFAGEGHQSAALDQPKLMSY